jgi:hypothetical protein
MSYLRLLGKSYKFVKKIESLDPQELIRMKSQRKESVAS